MKNTNFILLQVITLSAGSLLSLSENHTRDNSIKKLNVLLAAPPFAGHANPLLALGEELVRHGHNVTFCSLDNWVNLEKKSLERGIKYVSAGNYYLNESEFRELYIEWGTGLISNNPWIFYQALLLNKKHIQKNIDPILHYLKSQGIQEWDVVLMENFLAQSLPCLAVYNNISSIAVYNRPPNYQHMINYNLFEKFQSIVRTFLSTISLLHPYESTITADMCKKVFHSTPYEGWEYPVLIRSANGFEYPQTISPLTQYVGPLLSRLKQSLPTDLSKWIQNKEDNSVIYISMGSLLEIGNDLAMAFINGTYHTNYTVVWSLNKHNQHVLNNIELDTNKYFISSWTPQVTLLQHKCISMAILHGGSNGVHEALYYGIPLIVIPQFGDQANWAGKVKYSGVGVQLKPHQVTSQTIKKSIQTIESGGYHEKAQKMSQIMKRAGGVDKAADLVEFYVNVGYDHLIPGPVKYKWSWIQYYNIDVHVTLLCIILIVMYCIVKVCKCCCRYCCLKGKQKME